MSAFKTNNRFNILKETSTDSRSQYKPIEKTSNSFKDSFKDKSQRIKEEEEQRKKQEEQRKENEKQESLKASNFPDLVPKINGKSNKKQEKQKQKQEQEQEQEQKKPICYLDKIKNIPTKQEQPIVDQVKPGWGCATKDPLSNRYIYTYGETTYTTPEPKPIDVLYALADTYKRQIRQHDSLWGEGSYATKYQSPYYDYDYFDILDEEYEEENDSD